VEPNSNALFNGNEERHFENRLMQTLVFLAVNQGRVVYQYKHPFRDGSTHVVLEPLTCSGFLKPLLT
jgi:hypothetical protein